MGGLTSLFPSGGKDPQEQGYFRKLSGSKANAGTYPTPITVDCGFIPETIVGYIGYTQGNPAQYPFMWSSTMGGATVAMNPNAAYRVTAMSVTVNGTTITFIPSADGYFPSLTAWYEITGRLA